MALTADDHGLGLSPETQDGDLPEGWQTPTFRALQHLAVYAAPMVNAAAHRAYNAAWIWGHVTRHGEDDDDFYMRQAQYDDAEVALLSAMRRDLGIPEEDASPVS